MTKPHLVTRIVVCRDGAFHIGDRRRTGCARCRSPGEQVHVFGARCGVERCARIFGDGAPGRRHPGLRLRGRSLSRLRRSLRERGTTSSARRRDPQKVARRSQPSRTRRWPTHRHGTHDHARDGRSMLQPMFDRFENPCHNSLSGDFASPLRASGLSVCAVFPNEQEYTRTQRPKQHRSATGSVPDRKRRAKRGLFAQNACQAACVVHRSTYTAQARSSMMNPTL